MLAVPPSPVTNLNTQSHPLLDADLLARPSDTGAADRALVRRRGWAAFVLAFVACGAVALYRTSPLA